MTHFEYELAFRVVIGLAGCAMALVALALDWRGDWRNARGPGWRVGRTEPVTMPKVG